MCTKGKTYLTRQYLNGINKISKMFLGAPCIVQKYMTANRKKERALLDAGRTK